MTILDYLTRALNAPENQAGVRKFERTCGVLFDAINEFCSELEKQTAALSPSPGYEPWLTRRGTNPTVARLMARVLVRRGKRIETEEKQRKEIVGAIRFLRTHRTSRPAVSRRVKILLEAWEQTSLLQDLLDNAHIDASEFFRLLRAYELGDNDAVRQLRDSLATAQIHLSLRRGRKISTASAAHEGFLEFAVNIVEPGTYTWNDVEGTYTDPITEATRREFSKDRFNPQPVFRHGIRTPFSG